jgi:hypothetical protein
MNIVARRLTQEQDGVRRAATGYSSARYIRSS